MNSEPHRIDESTITLKSIFLELIKSKKKLAWEFSGDISQCYREFENTLVGELNQQLRIHGYSDIITREDWAEDYEMWMFETDED